ncbi:MAG: xylose isomerase [Eubacterium sp.]|nr:xylose isomerase [Eubacterium sp.]
MDNNLIAAQLFTLRDYLTTPEGIRDSFEKLKETGFKAIQVSGMGRLDPMLLRDLSEKLDLKICATHIPFDRIKNETAAVIEEHKIMDCGYVGIGSMPEEYARTREGYSRFARDASILGKKLSANGLKLIYHNHDFEFKKFDLITGLDILINESTPDCLGFEIDTYWVQAGGGSPVQWLKKVAGRIDVVHFKDMAHVDGKQEMAAVGEGNLDWLSIIQVCRENKVKWYAIEQDVCPRNPFDCLSSSLNYLQQYL